MENQQSDNEPIVLETQEERSALSPIPVKPQLAVLAVVLLLLLGGAAGTKIFSSFGFGDLKPTPGMLSEAVALPGSSFTTEALAQAFSDASITGDAAYVWDISTQQALFAKNAGEALPLASLTKLMTALVAHEILDPTATVSIGIEAARQDSSSGLAVGTKFESQSLSDLILMASSNDGAYALAATAGALLREDQGPEAFVAAMNVRAEELGLTQTRFLNPTGLDVSKTEAGGYGSARDVAFLMEHILENEPDILSLTTDSTARIWSESGNYVDAENTNFYIDEIPGLLGSKTGYTDLAGGNLTIAYDAGLNRPIVIVVLGSTQFDRFTDVMELVEATNALIATTSN